MNMKRRFEATYVEKIATKYDPEHGAAMTGRCVLCESISIHADSFSELVRRVKEHFFYTKPDDGYVFMPDGVESSYFGFNQLEDDDSCVIDSVDEHDGQVWLCDYTITFTIELVGDTTLTEADLKGLTLG